MSGPKCANYTLRDELRRKRDEENRRRRIEKKVKNNLYKIEVIIKKIEKEPHEKFAPGKLEQIVLKFKDYKKHVRKNRHENIKANVMQCVAEAETILNEIISKVNRWTKDKEITGQKVEKAQTAIHSANLDFIDKWAGSHFDKNSIIEKLQTVQELFQQEDFISARSVCDKMVADLEKAETEAIGNEENYRERKEVQEKVENVLRKMNLQIYETDESANPVTDPITIEATTGSYDIDINLNPDKSVKLNTQDDTIYNTTLGADCHKDVGNLH